MMLSATFALPSLRLPRIDAGLSLHDALDTMLAEGTDKVVVVRDDSPLGTVSIEHIECQAACDYAALPGCAERKRLLEESRAIARELGMATLLEQLELERIGGPGQEPATSRS